MDPVSARCNVTLGLMSKVYMNDSRSGRNPAILEYIEFQPSGIDDLATMATDIALRLLDRWV